MTRNKEMGWGMNVSNKHTSMLYKYKYTVLGQVVRSWVKITQGQCEF